MTRRFASPFGRDGKHLIVAIALGWAAVIVAVTGSLQGTPSADRLLAVLAVATLGSVAIVAVGVKAIHS